MASKMPRLVLFLFFPLVLGSSRSATRRGPTQRTQSGERNRQKAPSSSSSATESRDRSLPERDARRRSSRYDDSSGETRRRRKRRREVIDQDDTMDCSSSSFVPLVLSDDDEHEESILSALARVEQSEEEDQEDGRVQGVRVDSRRKHVVRVKKSSTVAPSSSVAHKTDSKVGGGEIEKPPRDYSGGEALSKNVAGVSSSVSGTRETQSADPPRPETPSDHYQSGQIPTIVQNSSGAVGIPPPQRPQGDTSSLPPPSTKSYVPSYRHSTRVVPPPPGPTPPQVVLPTQPSPDTTAKTMMAGTTPWARRFLSTSPHDALLPVPREYLSDGFNLVQLAPIVERIASLDEGYGACLATAQRQQEGRHSYPLFKAALRLILQEEESAMVVVTVQRAAEALYSLVHARYIISPRGLDAVRRILMGRRGVVEPVFGKCPRISCRGMPLMPVGDSDDYGSQCMTTTRAKRFCPCCGEKFYMWNSKVDGSAWGRSFCHLFLMMYGSDIFREQLNSCRGRVSGIPAVASALPKTTVSPSIFGFQLHPAWNLRSSTA